MDEQMMLLTLYLQTQFCLSEEKRLTDKSRHNFHSKKNESEEVKIKMSNTALFTFQLWSLIIILCNDFPTQEIIICWCAILRHASPHISYNYDPYQWPCFPQFQHLSLGDGPLRPLPSSINNWYWLFKLTCWFNNEFFSVKGSTVHAVDCISSRMIIIIFLY